MNRFEQAYLGLGSNLGDRHGYLYRAIEELRHDSHCTVNRVSSYYGSEALCTDEGPPFINAAVSVLWSGTARDLLARCQQIETDCGRERPYPNAPRTLDIDILFWEGFECSDPDLTIPHRELINRGFALLPLLEIAPHLKRPESGMPLSGSLRMDLLNQGIHRDEVRGVHV